MPPSSLEESSAGASNTSIEMQSETKKANKTQKAPLSTPLPLLGTIPPHLVTKTATPARVTNLGKKGRQTQLPPLAPRPPPQPQLAYPPRPRPRPRPRPQTIDVTAIQNQHSPLSLLANVGHAELKPKTMIIRVIFCGIVRLFQLEVQGAPRESSPVPGIPRDSTS